MNLITRSTISAPGQSLPKWDVRATSAFALIATELQTSLDVSNVPKVEMMPTRDHRWRAKWGLCDVYYMALLSHMPYQDGSTAIGQSHQR
jgi:hypothetical protein